MRLHQPILIIVGLSVAAVKSQIFTASASIVPTSLPTNAHAVSSVLATATLAPNLGNPADITKYPLCVQICANVTFAAGVGCDLSDLNCICGAAYISATGACEQVTCSDADREQSALLAQQLCDPLYSSSPGLGASVTSALVSATSFAAAAVKSKDATDPASYPPCGQKCINENLPASGCGSLSNRKCVCQQSNFHQNTRPCEQAACSASDLEMIVDLSYVLCNPVGGEIVEASNGSYVRPGAGNSTQTPIPYTGGGPTLMGSFAWGAMTLIAIVGAGILLS